MTQGLNPDKMRSCCCFCSAPPLQASARCHRHSSEQSHIQALINRSIFAPLLYLVQNEPCHLQHSWLRLHTVGANLCGVFLFCFFFSIYLPVAEQVPGVCSSQRLNYELPWGCHSLEQLSPVRWPSAGRGRFTIVVKKRTKEMLNSS